MVIKKYFILHSIEYLKGYCTMYTPIIGTLGYVVSPDRSRTLMIHRNKRADDIHLGKYNGLGGKLRPDEDVLTCLRRELREEAGIDCEEIILRGTINWTGFGPGGENWLGFIFRIDRFTGAPYENSGEGALSWELIERLQELPMWPGDRYFLPLVFDSDPRLFHGCMPYRNGRPVDWNYVRV